MKEDLIQGANGPVNQAGCRPDRVILLVIDGLRADAPDRLGLPEFLALSAEGARFREMEVILPIHPFGGLWAVWHTTSIPNPVMLAGSLYIQSGQPLLQQSFLAVGPAAHVANSTAYASLNRGFSFSMMRDGDDRDAMETAIDWIDRHDIRFMRIHLQDTGKAGIACAFAGPEIPWKNNIWAGNSPYIAAAREADRLLGCLVSSLQKTGKWESTLLVVTADHGQADAGWHPVTPKESALAPLLFAGCGVGKGRVFDYAEITDIAPTICHGAGVQAPNSDGAAGRVLTGVFQNEPAHSEYPRHLSRLNALLRDYVRLSAQIRTGLPQHPEDESDLMFCDMKTLHLDRFTDWPQSQTVELLIENLADGVLKLQGVLDRRSETALMPKSAGNDPRRHCNRSGSKN